MPGEKSPPVFGRIEEREWDEARAHVPIIAGSIGDMADQVQRAASAIVAIDR